MSATHEQPASPDSQRNEILERSPMLKSMINTGDILDEVRMQSRGNMIAAIHAKYGKDASDEMIEDSLATTIASVANLFVISGVVDKKRLAEDGETIQASDAIAEAFFTIGFEIGEIDDAVLFLPELTQFLLTYDSDRNNVFFSAEARQALQDPAVQQFLMANAVYPALGYGVIKRQLMTKGNSRKAISSPGRKRSDGFDLSLYNKALADSPVNFDPRRPDIPVAIRRAFAADPNDALDLPEPPPPYSIMDDVRQLIDELPESGEEEKPED